MSAGKSVNSRLAVGLLCLGASAAITGCADGDRSGGASATSPTTTPPASAADRALRHELDRLLLRNLVEREGQARSRARCAVAAFDRGLTDEQLRDAVAAVGRTGEPPRALLDLAFDAGAECARAGG